MKKGRKTEKDERSIHIRLPIVIHRQLRIRAAELDVSLQRLVEKMIEKELGKKELAT